ncbi:glycoside hydrolase family 15 protein [Methanolobus chelungpuianus]|uniref:Glucan 1,4-alpha-glucosidase n=1 Tax=Methanolobus chelungpuianus TaxID=502115 RepID=A0AAE3KWP0_9EURY|nr:glycoside hydrolase family 15 protein [Methanolobus chelungpuianus]MCQ6962287.1 glucan 1,4-alpha-glucosidase [Methanolobus chelungpuianus]
MIRQPNAILGNEKLLVTMGKKAEIFGFFYPGRDFAQHVEESQACLHDGKRLIWSDDHEWHATQSYIEDTNVVVTHLRRQGGLSMDILDLAHPSHPIMVRNYRISASEGFHGRFYYYSKFQAGETVKKNSAFCDPEARILVHYWRNYHLGLSSRPSFEEWQVGRALDSDIWTNALYDMRDGQLHNKREEIGRLNSAIGWKLDIEPGSGREITVFIGAAPTREMLYSKMRTAGTENVERMVKKVYEERTGWLSGSRRITLPQIVDDNREDLISAFNRSLLTLSLLSDPEEGSFVAAPEFDHEFELSGGYGYCWNRDAAETVLALLNAGYPDFCMRFFRWCRKTQLSDGSWFQRYWLDGSLGSSWGNFSFSTQMDETGATLFAMGRYFQGLQPASRSAFLSEIWPSVLPAAEYLMRRTTGGLHDSCTCLWESYKGTFTHTNAAIYGGLTGAANIAAEYGEQELASRWLGRAKLIKEATVREFWLPEGYFARGRVDGRTDTEVDASILGVFVPFGMLSADDEREREMILSTIRTVEKKLGVPVNGHRGIKRYETDNYIDGNPWIVTTLWLSRALLALAGSGERTGNETEGWKAKSEALEYIRWALRGATSTGLLPEQVNRHTGEPAWAIPLSWSCALMLENLIVLDELDNALLIDSGSI